MSPAAKAPTRLISIVGALGVVFGDIGTSPLYALRTMLHDGGPVGRTSVLGLTSLAVWSLLVVVSALYVGVLLRTDNEGEGGLLALVALLRRTTREHRTLAVVSVLGMVGAATFLGDCVVTPAISVLSAAEGLEVASPSLKVIVLPLALVILAGVFVLQKVGSGRIGQFYGPVMVVWFAILAAGGLASLLRTPDALQALSPLAAARYLAADPGTGFLALGAVVLAVTGAEALYADLAHFGRPAISRAWVGIVLPALLVAYLGEAAAVLRDPTAASNPFYAVVPGWARIPVLVAATLATVIASEAVIAGAFTVLHQAGGLGLFPYLRTEHTSRKEPGRIYLPAVNWALAAVVLLVVAGFRESAKLSSAYGVAVTGTFLVTITLYAALQRARHPGSLVRLLVPAAFFLVLLAFFAATLPKVLTGGWVPVTIAAVLYLVMSTWWTGHRRLQRALDAEECTPAELIERVDGSTPRLPGTSVYLTDDRRVAPFALQAMVELGYPLSERVVLLSWHVEDTPGAPADRAAVEVDAFEDRYAGVRAVEVTLGYRERLDVAHVLADARAAEPELLDGVDADDARFFVSDPIPRLSRDRHLARWRQRLFLLVDRLATDRVEHLRLPRGRTVVLGREYDL